MFKNNNWKIYGSSNDITLLNSHISNQIIYFNDNANVIKKIRILCYSTNKIFLAFNQTPYLENKIYDYEIKYIKSGSDYGELHVEIIKENENEINKIVKYLLDVENSLTSENILEILNEIGIKTYKNYWKNQANYILNELKNKEINQDFLDNLEKYINNLNYSEEEYKFLRLYLVNNLINDEPNIAQLFINDSDDLKLYNKVLFYQELLKENFNEKEHLTNLIIYGIKAELWDEVKLYFNKLSGKKFGENIDIDIKDHTKVILYLADLIYKNN